jgi:hypothetical protein
MAFSIASSKTFAAGETVTPTKLTRARSKSPARKSKSK